MFEVGEDGHGWRGLEACGPALLLCLLLAPGAIAQGVWHLRVRQTATQSLTLIKPSDPLFEGMIDTYYPGISQEPGYQTSIKPFLVLVRNDTALPAVAYAIMWRVHYKDCSVKSQRAVFVNRHLMFRPAMTYLPPRYIRLIAPMFNVTPKEYERDKPSYGWYPANSFPRSEGLSSVDVNVDGVVYGDGTFIGPDKTRVLQSYLMAKFAERDEILAALNLIRSSAGTSPLAVVSQLEKMFNDEFQFSQRAYQDSLLAKYVRARGTTATDLSRILQDRGLTGFEKLLGRFVGGFGENHKPSTFGREYQRLSDKDPRVFGITPWKPPEGPSPSPTAVAAAAAAGQPFTLTIVGPKVPLVAGCPLRLLVTVEDTSGRPITLVTSPGVPPDDTWDYHIDVRDAHGRPARPSAFALSLRGKHTLVAGSFVGHRLDPGATFVDEVSVTKDFDLREPGKYTIRVSRFLGPVGHPGKGVVKSNVVTVTVVK